MYFVTFQAKQVYYRWTSLFQLKMIDPDTAAPVLCLLISLCIYWDVEKKTLKCIQKSLIQTCL